MGLRRLPVGWRGERLHRGSRIVVDMGEMVEVKGLSCLPCQDGQLNLLVPISIISDTIWLQ